MQDFIDEGNIRTTGTGVDISAEPTKAQYDKLYDYIDFIKNKNELIIYKKEFTLNKEFKTIVAKKIVSVGSKIEAIMNGDIDELVDALVTADTAKKLQASEG